MKVTKKTGTFNDENAYTFVEFKPAGTFYQKINTLLKLVHYKLDDGIFKKIRSKKKYITYLPSLLKKKPKDILIIYKYGTKNGKTYTNKKGFVKNTAFDQYGNKQLTAFKIISEFYSFISDEPITAENLMKAACKNLMDNYYAYQVSLSDESEPWPLHSVTFKFI